MFRKQGYDVKEHQILNLLEFENWYMRGMVTFSKPFFKIKWDCKKGYEIFDVPTAPGGTTSQFKNVKDLLDFLQRRLVFKKSSS